MIKKKNQKTAGNEFPETSFGGGGLSEGGKPSGKVKKPQEGKVKEISKEQAILEAAEQEFLDKGFEAAKTTKIALLAGVTHAMLHYYYRTKENLFDKVFEIKVGLLKDSLFHSFDKPDMPFLERIQCGLESHFDFIRNNPGLPRFVINELLFKPKRLELFEKKIRKVAGGVIAEISEEMEAEIRKGTINRIDPITLLIDIASLNVFVFIAMPLLRTFAMDSYDNEDAFLEARKKENVEIIMRRLKK
ncbi:MAG: TetR/AcrR family transcriptional regulator [Tannerella sp.]|jgi:AcrR family transcriptional regulator|nr:TetR/AcrR family transcriptional regulator [Tannerella sp.]